MCTACKRKNEMYPECLGCFLMSQNFGKVIRPIRIVRLYDVLNFNDSDWSYEINKKINSAIPFSKIPTVIKQHPKNNDFNPETGYSDVSYFW